MKQDDLLLKLQEIGSFLACIVVILAVAYFSGFLKGFTPADFQDAYYNIASNFNKEINVKNSNGNRTALRYGSYRPNNIPKELYATVNDSGFWRNLLYTNKKVVFYIYDKDLKFHNQIQNYLAGNPGKYYSLEAVNQYYFDKLKWGYVGPSKICDSIAECNDQRKKALSSTIANDFLRQCGKGICVFNPSNKQYVMLRNQKPDAAIKMLDELIYW